MPAGQPGTAYTYFLSELGGDENPPILELAFAITIHKSQGSEFGKTFVVIPNPVGSSRESCLTPP